MNIKLETKQTHIWHPKYEGIDHVNMYSKSKLPLGRALSNFFRSMFIHPKYGQFASVEGFYYWLLSGQTEDKLRDLHGYAAKQLGESLPKKVILNKSFKEDVQEAIALKIISNSYIQRLLIESDLPIAHYYYYGDPMGNVSIVDKYEEHKYMVDAIEEIQVNLKIHGEINKNFS